MTPTQVAEAQRLTAVNLVWRSLFGERIYHMPSGRWYDRTKLDPAKGERWLCSEAEAGAVKYACRKKRDASR